MSNTSEIAVVCGLALFGLLLFVFMYCWQKRDEKMLQEMIEEWEKRRTQPFVTITLNRKQAAEVYLKLFDIDALAGSGVCETLLQIEKVLGAYYNDK